MSFCVICNTPGDNLTVVKRGIERIVQFSTILNDGVNKRITESDEVLVHESCRKSYTRRQPEEENKGIKGCSSFEPQCQEDFDFGSSCLLCGRPAQNDHKHPDRTNVTEMVTLSMINKIRERAEERSDNWGDIVSSRLKEGEELIGAHSRFHRSCWKYFFNQNSNVPGVKLQPPGRPKCKASLQSFEKLCTFIESNNQRQFTLSELVQVMAKLNPAAEQYSEKHLKRILLNYYGSAITITESAGQNNILYFSEYRDVVLTEKWQKEKTSNDLDLRKKIVMQAAKIIREDIQSQKYDCSHYPSSEDILSGSEDLIPEMLSYLMNEIIVPKKSASETVKYKRKSQAIQHCVVAATRPRSFISPVLHGISVYLHRKFGSRTLIDVLSNLGFCNSYKETMRFEASVTLTKQPVANESSYVQFIFDNADHNIRTIDGFGTFHVMGGLMCVSPASSVPPEPQFKRSLELVPILEDEGYMKLKWYKHSDKPGLANVVAQDLSEENLSIKPESADQAEMLDIFWATTFLSDIRNFERPGWNGFMELSHKHLPCDKSALIPLPFINHNPSNLSTINTALQFAASEAKALNQAKVFVTFDQPLCHKAYEIVSAAPDNSDLSSVEVRLGGFHLLMSFLGAIGKIMGGSGIEDLWGIVYAPNTVVNMMNGKQYARSLRAHFITQQVLIHLVFLTCNERADIIDSLEHTLSDILSGDLFMNQAIECRDVNTAVTSLKTKMFELSRGSRTAKLWLQYVELVEIVRLYIRAERSGDWNLHLYCVQRMLPYLHASGHYNYAKTAHIYLQRMLHLTETMPLDQLEKFVGKSYFTIRRNDKFWSGTWTDMIIEQFLMRSMKSTGGLTHGRGFKTSTVTKWIKSMPATTNVVDAVESFSGVSSQTTEQHVELKDSRIQRDSTDTLKMFEWLNLHNPFRKVGTSLVCISNGLVADSKVNCDSAKEVGLRSMALITGKSFDEIHMTRKNVVITLGTMQKGIRIRDDIVEVDSNLLFQRMVCVLRSDEELRENLKFELAAWPSTLFKDCLMRKGSGKSTLIPVLDSFYQPTDHLPCETNNICYTVDGGYLLHKCLWQRHEKFKDIACKYVSYVCTNYGTDNVTVVFDGYTEVSTKGYEQERRGTSSEIIVEEESYAVLSQEHFLANRNNKARLIDMLSKHLQAKGIKTTVADADADLLIVTNGITHGKCGKISVIVGEDTDLIVLLTALSDSPCYLLIPCKGKRPQKVYSIEGLQRALGEMKDVLLFLHAFTGCDTTSAIHGKGKSHAFNVLKQDDALRNIVAVFSETTSTQEVISKAGESFMCVLFGGNCNDNLDQLRYTTYLKKVTKQKVVNSLKLELLPPTSDAARHHSFRVYLQVQEWNNNKLDPQNWGWKNISNVLRPIPTVRLPAPQHLLCLISCGCKKGCENKTCECLRNGLKCSSMCGYCSGQGCLNRDGLENDEDEEEIAGI